jgi:glycosyltransferase involved in cell wall biosynthesis
MKIAFFCDAYTPTRSGVAVSVLSTAQELRARGHRVVIYAPRYKGHLCAEDDVIRFPAGHWYCAKDFPVTIPVLPHLSLREEYRFGQEQFDIVHSHSPFTLGTLGYYWAQRCNIPLVFTFHTLYHRYLHYVPLPRNVTRSYVVWKVGHYCEGCDHVIAPSRPVSQIVHHLAPGVPESIIPTGVNIKKFSGGDGAAVRRQYGIGKDEIVLLYVGRIVHEKNLAFLLSAIAPLLLGKLPAGMVRQAGHAPRVRLMMVGGGEELPAISTVAEGMGLEDRVIFTDFVDPSEIADYYAASDIFTFASRTETQGVSIAEALVAGLPCVVVGAMGAAEAVTDGVEGFVVPPRERAFRAALSRLIADKELRLHMAANARRKAPSLSLEASADKIESLYEGLMVTGRRTVPEAVPLAS